MDALRIGRVFEWTLLWFGHGCLGENGRGTTVRAGMLSGMAWGLSGHCDGSAIYYTGLDALQNGMGSGWTSSRFGHG